MQLRDTFKNTARVAACFGMLFGLLGWLSWVLNVPQLFMLRAVPATSFALCGVALNLLCCQQHRVLQWVGRATAVVVFAACAASMLGKGAGTTSSGILADNPYQALVSALFGTMSLYDVVGFAMLSLAIMLMGSRWLGERGVGDLLAPNTNCGVRSWFAPSEWLAGFGFVMATMAAIGTLFEQARFCLFVSCQDLSLLAVAVYGLLCAGALLANTQTGLMIIMESPGAGGMAARRILPGALAIPIALGVLRVVSLKFNIADSATVLPVAICLMLVAFLSLIWTSSLKLERKDALLNQAMNTLEQSEQRVRTIINESVDAFVAINDAGKITEWSSRAETMFGISRAVAMGGQLGLFLTPAVEKELRGYFSDADAPGQLATTENKSGELLQFAMAKADGATIDIEVMPFLIRAQDELLCCAFVRDVTQRKQLEQRFQDFYHAVSHELRSPLTAIRCSLESVNESQSTNLDTDARKQLHNAIGASDRLIQLINDLLDLRRIELGKFSFQSMEADPILLAQAAVDTLTPLANLKSVDVILVAESSLPVTCDPARTEQVLINLISNAIKFSPAKARIIVTCSDSEQSDRVRFSVKDEGPGIPDNQASRLFESFEQLQSPGWEYIPGTGLGLAISRRIVEELGGAIGHYNNEDARGSTFWFELLKPTRGAPDMVISAAPGDRAKSPEPR